MISEEVSLATDRGRGEGGIVLVTATNSVSDFGNVFLPEAIGRAEGGGWVWCLVEELLSAIIPCAGPSGLTYISPCASDGKVCEFMQCVPAGPARIQGDGRV